MVVQHTPAAPVAVGLIGAGSIAARHARAYRARPEHVRLGAVADLVADNATAVAEPTGAQVFAEYADMLACPGIDAVDICLPHHLHAPAIVAAARQGKHILVEKPLCVSLREAAEITEAVETAGVTVMCSHNRLFSPVATHARRLLSQGLLGRIYEVNATDCFRLEAGAEELGWRTRLDTCGGGELIDTGYHPAYLILALAGGVPVNVAAMTSRHRLDFLEGEDSARVLVRFDNGVVGHIATSWAYQPPDSYDHFSVAGELGSLWASRTTLGYRLHGREPVVLTYEKGDDVAAAVDHFIDCLTTGARPLHTHREGAEVLALVLAAYESAATGTMAAPRPVPRPVAAR